MYASGTSLTVGSSLVASDGGASVGAVLAVGVGVASAIDDGLGVDLGELFVALPIAPRTRITPTAMTTMPHGFRHHGLLGGAGGCGEMPAGGCGGIANGGGGDVFGGGGSVTSIGFLL